MGVIAVSSLHGSAEAGSCMVVAWRVQFLFSAGFAIPNCIHFILVIPIKASFCEKALLLFKIY